MDQVGYEFAAFQSATMLKAWTLRTDHYTGVADQAQRPGTTVEQERAERPATLTPDGARAESQRPGGTTFALEEFAQMKPEVSALDARRAGHQHGGRRTPMIPPAYRGYGSSVAVSLLSGRRGDVGPRFFSRQHWFFAREGRR